MDKRLGEINKELEEKEIRLVNLEKMNKILSVQCAALEKFELHVRVKEVFHHKKRGNTTVVFLDGSSETVKRRKGDKDCIHTAVAYALAKHIYNLNKIVKNIQEVGE